MWIASPVKCGKKTIFNDVLIADQVEFLHYIRDTLFKLGVRLDLLLDFFDTVDDRGMVLLVQKLGYGLESSIRIFPAEIHDDLAGQHAFGILFSGGDSRHFHVIVFTDGGSNHFRRDGGALVRINDILQGFS